jgi:hypothetical protein
MLYFNQMMSLTPTVCCRGRLDSSSFRRLASSNLPSGVSIFWDSSDPVQTAFADLLRCLPVFLWKLDTADKKAYSLAPTGYPRLPFFSFDGRTSYQMISTKYSQSYGLAGVQRCYLVAEQQELSGLSFYHRR